MSKPGSFYIVKQGDRLRAIARRTYGRDSSDKIVDANIDLLKGRPISLEGLPTIYKGDNIWLPDTIEQFSNRIASFNDDEITIRLDGKLFKGWTASSIQRNINTVADAFTFTLPYDYTDETLRELTKPYSYKKCDIFIGSELYISAQTVKWSTQVGANQTTKTIDARTKAGHTVECMAQKKAVEYKNETLAFIATDIMGSYGDDLKPVFFNGDSDKFTRVRKEITDTDFDFLSGLAAQKGFMITSSDDGRFAFIRAETQGLPVFKFIEGETAIEHISVVSDGTKRFSSMQAVTETSGTAGTSSTLSDKNIPVYRPYVFSADDLEAGNLGTALQWRRSKALADSYSLSITVTGWRNSYGQLWRENMKGTVKFPSVDIFTESDYIISSVTLTKDESGGNISQLIMVIPQAYSLEFPSKFPWEG